MSENKSTKFLLIAGVLGIWILIFQNFGVIPKVQPEEVDVGNTVRVEGEMGVSYMPEPLEVDIRKINGWNAANYQSYTHDGEEYHSLGCR